MTPKQAQKWAAALRSGKYKQGGSELYNSFYNTYCCLGVLCSVNKERHYGHVLPRKNLHAKTYEQLGGSYPEAFGKRFEYLNDIGYVEADGTGKTSSDDRLTFDEIADLIELKFVHGAEG